MDRQPLLDFIRNHSPANPDVILYIAGHFEAVNIAKNNFCWFKSFQLVDDPRRPDVAGMPYFITVIKMIEDTFIQVTVRV